MSFFPDLVLPLETLEVSFLWFENLLAFLPLLMFCFLTGICAAKEWYYWGPTLECWLYLPSLPMELVASTFGYPTLSPRALSILSTWWSLAEAFLFCILTTLSYDASFGWRFTLPPLRLPWWPLPPLLWAEDDFDLIDLRYCEFPWPITGI